VNFLLRCLNFKKSRDGGNHFDEAPPSHIIQCMFNIKTLMTASLIAICVPIITEGCSPAIINNVIDTKTAYEMIQSNQDDPDFVLVDVRTPAEFNAEHIANAILVDYEAPDFAAKIGELDRNKKYLVYCRTARRSGLAVKVMKDLGFQEVYDMAKGINQWKSDGYPVVTD
jgi:rhodanese-related sulfurtransferase